VPLLSHHERFSHARREPTLPHEHTAPSLEPTAAVVRLGHMAMRLTLHLTLHTGKVYCVHCGRTTTPGSVVAFACLPDRFIHCWRTFHVITLRLTRLG
jgi:hypothetical protein